MTLIWVTRGRRWGFRFLMDGGFSDPLPEYDKAFSWVADQPEVCRRTDDRVALRFPDPEGRRDRAGRVIPHEFVILGPEAHEIHSVEDGYRLVWPRVRDAYGHAWDAPSSAVQGGHVT